MMKIRSLTSRGIAAALALTAFGAALTTVAAASPVEPPATSVPLDPVVAGVDWSAEAFDAPCGAVDRIELTGGRFAPETFNRDGGVLIVELADVFELPTRPGYVIVQLSCVAGGPSAALSQELFVVIEPGGVSPTDEAPQSSTVAPEPRIAALLVAEPGATRVVNDDGVIVVDDVIHGANDPQCCPSVFRSQQIVWDDDGGPVVVAGARPDAPADAGAAPSTCVATELTAASAADDVLTLESALAAAGFDPGTVDGTFDDTTISAVVRFIEFNAGNPALHDDDPDRPYDNLHAEASKHGVVRRAVLTALGIACDDVARLPAIAGLTAGTLYRSRPAVDAPTAAGPIGLPPGLILCVAEAGQAPTVFSLDPDTGAVGGSIQLAPNPGTPVVPVCDNLEARHYDASYAWRATTADTDEHRVAGVVANTTGEFADLSGTGTTAADSFAVVAIADTQGVVVRPADRLYWKRTETGAGNADPYRQLIASAPLAGGGDVEVVTDRVISSAVDGLQVSGGFVSAMEIHTLPGGDELFVVDRLLGTLGMLRCVAPQTPLVTADWVYDFGDPTTISSNCVDLDVQARGTILAAESPTSWISLTGVNVIRYGADGSEESLLPDSARQLDWIVAAPDATRLAMSTLDPDGTRSIWILDLATGQFQPVALPSELIDRRFTLNDWTA